MRDIKFRIYFKDEEPFMTEPISLEDLLHEDWIEFENKEGTLSLPLKDFRFFYSKNENYEIMQNTKLHDKNEKEIYEGDILKIDDRYYAVFFDRGSFCVGIPEEELQYGYNYKADLFDVCVRREDEEKPEIVGNMYDNPELLEWEEGE